MLLLLLLLLPVIMALWVTCGWFWGMYDPSPLSHKGTVIV